MGVFPVTPLAAGNKRKPSIPKVFEEIADLAWHRNKLPQPIRKARPLCEHGMRM
jgi:hypothetical protein